MYFQQITDSALAQNAYLVGCQATGQAIIIDPQRDIGRYTRIADENGLAIIAAAETHIHADYLSGLRQFAHKCGTRIYASDEGSADWKYEWLIGSEYDYVLLYDRDSFAVGNIRFDVIHTPGHTPEHIVFLVTDSSRDDSHPLGIITGDFVFVGDVGRPDLLETAAQVKNSMVGSAEELFDSLQHFKHLNPGYLVWPGHGAGSACGKQLGAVPTSTVGYELATNPSILAASDKESFSSYILAGQPEPPAYFARMKVENRQGPAVLEERLKPECVPNQRIADVLKNSSNIIVDCRDWETFRAGHLPGALFIPLEAKFSTLAGSYVDPAKRIYFVIQADRVNEAITECIRVGLDNIGGWIDPESVSEYQSTGGSIAFVEEFPVTEVDSRRSDNAILLDVRRAVELEETGTIEGSHNIAHLQLAIRCTEIPDNKTVHVICRTGNRSRYATAYLNHIGVNAANVTGGVVEWMDNSGRLVPFQSHSPTE